MLILTRKSGQSVMINKDIKITVIDIKGNQVRMGIEAPRNVSVHREEVFDMINKEEPELSP